MTQDNHISVLGAIIAKVSELAGSKEKQKAAVKEADMIFFNNKIGNPQKMSLLMSAVQLPGFSEFFALWKEYDKESFMIFPSFFDSAEMKRLWAIEKELVLKSNPSKLAQEEKNVNAIMAYDKEIKAYIESTRNSLCEEMDALNQVFASVITTEKYDALNDMETPILQLKKLKEKLDDTKISRLFESSDYMPLTDAQNSILAKFKQTAESVELLQKRVDASNHRVYLEQRVESFANDFTQHGSEYACDPIKHYLDIDIFPEDYKLPEHAYAVGQLTRDLLNNASSHPGQKAAAEEIILNYITHALNNVALSPQHKTEIVMGLLSHDALTGKACQSVLTANSHQLDMKKLIDTTSNEQWHSKSHSVATNRMITELKSSASPNGSHINFIQPHDNPSKPVVGSESKENIGTQHVHKH